MSYPSECTILSITPFRQCRLMNSRKVWKKQNFLWLTLFISSELHIYLPAPPNGNSDFCLIWFGLLLINYWIPWFSLIWWGLHVNSFSMQNKPSSWDLLHRAGQVFDQSPLVGWGLKTLSSCWYVWSFKHKWGEPLDPQKIGIMGVNTWF